MLLIALSIGCFSAGGMWQRARASCTSHQVLVLLFLPSLTLLLIMLGQRFCLCTKNSVLVQYQTILVLTGGC